MNGTSRSSASVWNMFGLSVAVGGPRASYGRNEGRVTQHETGEQTVFLACLLPIVCEGIGGAPTGGRGTHALDGSYPSRAKWDVRRWESRRATSAVRSARA